MLPTFRWHVGFGGVHMKCQNLLWANLSQQNLNLGDVQPKKKAGIKAAVSWLNVYLRCLACQNSVVCCLKNEASKKKWRRKWRVKLMHLCIQSIAVLGVDGLQPRNMVGVSWKKSNNPASLISNCLFWAYPGRLWKVSFHMLKNVCSCSFLDTSYFANSWNTECTQGLGVFFLWHFSALDLDGIMSFCYCGAQGHQDETCRQDPEIYMPPCHPILPPPHPHLPPQPSRSTAHPPGKKGDKGGMNWFFFSVENPLVVISFGGVFVDVVCRLLRKATLNTGISQYQTLGKTKAYLSSNISQGSTGNGGVLDISIYGRDFNKLHLSCPL